MLGTCWCSYIENHAVIVDIEEDSLLAKSGVSVGDALEELCGEYIREESHGKVSSYVWDKRGALYRILYRIVGGTK